MIRAVLLSASEAELGALFIDEKLIVMVGTILVKLWHPQPWTTPQIDNSTEYGLLTDRITPKATK